MRRRRRAIEVFTLSFLDCICCGFGAVILFYTIVSAQAGVVRMKKTDAMSAEVSRLAEQVLDGSRQLAVLRNALERTRVITASTASRSSRIVAELRTRDQDVSTYDAENVARRRHIEELKSDVRSLEEGVRRLEAGSVGKGPPVSPTQQIASFRQSGGDRHYITGLTLRGKRILILLDVSASMLHEDVVTVIRMRNFDDARKRAAAKWRRAVETVDWLTTQLPEGSEYQIYIFSTRAQPLLPATHGAWIKSTDATQLARGAAALDQIVPRDGTSLYNAFSATRTLSPLPDQVVLLTDGLPTQGKTAGSRRYVDSGARMRLFDEAVGQLPDKVPIDTVLLPMNGDPQAAHRFWHLARLTDGNLLMPSKDWP
jgi:polyhydroxyalkanoate synthesis regulator phasin